MLEQRIDQLEMEIINEPGTGNLAIVGTGFTDLAIDVEDRFGDFFQFSYKLAQDELSVHAVGEHGLFEEIPPEKLDPLFESELSNRIVYDERSICPGRGLAVAIQEVDSSCRISGAVEGRLKASGTEFLFGFDASGENMAMNVLCMDGDERSVPTAVMRLPEIQRTLLHEVDEYFLSKVSGTKISPYEIEIEATVGKRFPKEIQAVYNLVSEDLKVVEGPPCLRDNVFLCIGEYARQNFAAGLDALPEEPEKAAAMPERSRRAQNPAASPLPSGMYRFRIPEGKAERGV